MTSVQLRRSHRLPLLRPGLIVGLLLLASGVFAQVSVNSPLSIEIEVLPGSRHTGTIVLENVGSESEEVRLYQTDYRSVRPGSFYYEDPGSQPRSNASWISVAPLRFSIPPGARYLVPYTIDVPADETLSGTYWSVLMIEPVPPTSPESVQAAPDQVAVGVVTLLRYAVRIVTHVGEAGVVQPHVDAVTVELRDGVPTLLVGLSNTGTRMVRLAVWTELYDAAGRMVARREGSGGTLFPGSSLEYRIPLTEIERGAYTALVLLDAGDNNVFGVSISLTLQ